MLLNGALKLVEELILYYDARSKKHQSCRGSQNPHFMFHNVLWKVVSFMGNVEKYGRGRQATDGNIVRCRKDAQEYTHTHTHTHTHTQRICNTHCFSHCNGDYIWEDNIKMDLHGSGRGLWGMDGVGSG